MAMDHFASSFPLGSALVRLRSDLSGAIRDSRHGGIFASGHRLRSARAKGLKKANGANVLVAGICIRLRRENQGETKRLGNFHYESDSVSKFPLSGMLPRRFAVRKPLSHGYFPKRRTAESDFDALVPWDRAGAWEK